MSSSDGQRFPVPGKSLTSREMVIHGGRVLSTYTHVSDQWSTYGTKIIVPTAREAHYALDEFLGNATDLPVTEHATDTHGVDQLRAVRPGWEGADAQDAGPDEDHPGAGRHPGRDRQAYPHAGPLLAARWNEDLISDCWPDLLRMGGSMKYGQASAWLIVGK